MNTEAAELFRYFEIGIILVFICGIYSIMITRNFMKVVVGIELLFEAVKLLILLAGHTIGHMATAQALVINIIVVEAVAVSVTLCIIIKVYKHNQSLDVRKLRELKG